MLHIRALAAKKRFSVNCEQKGNTKEMIFFVTGKFHPFFSLLHIHTLNIAWKWVKIWVFFHTHNIVQIQQESSWSEIQQQYLCSNIKCTFENNHFIIQYFLSLSQFSFKEWYGLLSSSFAAILLLSSSTLVAIVLIIQSELEMETSSIYASMTKLANDNSGGGVGGGGNDMSKMKKLSIKTNTTTTTPSTDGSDVLSEHHNHQTSGEMTLQKHQQRTAMKFSNLSSTNRGVKSAIGLSWLLPILCAMCIPMIHKIMGHRSNEWWLEIASSDFIIFAITEILLVSLFMLLFITLLKHLIYLTRKYEKANLTLKKRWEFSYTHVEEFLKLQFFLF